MMWYASKWIFLSGVFFSNLEEIDLLLSFSKKSKKKLFFFYFLLFNGKFDDIIYGKKYDPDVWWWMNYEWL